MTQTEDGSGVLSDDVIELFVDPYARRRDYYHLAVNPLGTRYSAGAAPEKRFDPDWDGQWQAETTIEEDRWIAEIRLPFDTFGSVDPDSIWLMGINRTGPGKPDSSWTDGSRHDPNAFGRIIFVREEAEH